MKIKIVMTLLTTLVLSSSLAFGQSVSLDGVDGLAEPGKILVNQEITFNIRLNNNTSEAVLGMFTGFSINSPDGATWTTTFADTISHGWTWPVYPPFYDNFEIFSVDVDGQNTDTVGFGGLQQTSASTGLPAGFNEVAFTITIGPIDPSFHGKTIVLDSTWFPTIGTWKWNPQGPPAWDGPHTFTIHDPDYVPSNTPPTLDPIGYKSIDEGDPLNFTVKASDVDGDLLYLTNSVLPAGATFIDNGDGTGDFNWTPTFDQGGVPAYSITFTASDDEASVQETIEITVNDKNRAPELTFIGDKNVTENQTLHFNINASDPDDDLLYLTAPVVPPGASFVDNGDGTGTFDWTPSFNDAGSYPVTFFASDGIAPPVQETITIEVYNLNRVPVLASIGDKSVNENENLNFVISATDEDGTILNFSAFVLPEDLPLPDGATLTDNGDNTATFDWTLTFDDASVLTFRFDVTDGEEVASETITITVINVDRDPVIDPIGNKFVTAGDLIEFIVTASDPDGTIPVMDATLLPGTATFSDNGDGSGTFSWQTVVQDNGTFGATFTATADGVTVEESIDITIGDAPKYLVAEPNTLQIELTQVENETGTLNINVSELNGFNVLFDASVTGSWLSLGGFAGETTPFDLSIDVNAAGMNPGVWFDTVFVTSTETVNSADTVVIELTLLEKPNIPAIFETVFDEVYTISECDTLSILVVGSDEDEDHVFLGIKDMVENMNFTDYHLFTLFDTGLFIFTPNFSQAGTYPLTAYVTDGTVDTAWASFTVIVEECEPGTEGDTVTVHTISAVPGAQVVVPIDFANICTLTMRNVSLRWTSEYMILDSVSFVDSRNTLWSVALINNEANTIEIPGGQLDIETQEPGTGNLVNLHFSLAVGTPAGFYPIDLLNEPFYERNCGGDNEVVRPFFIPGGIVVDVSGNYVCGYVVDTDGATVSLATVELWDDYPSGSVIMTTTANGNGVFAFSDFTTVPFDLHGYQSGYLPGIEENLNFAQSGITIVLTPIEQVQETNTWVFFQCQTGVTTYLGAPIPVGTVVEAYVRGDVKCGEFTVIESGVFGPMAVYGEDNSANPIPGAQVDDVISFYVNGVLAIPSQTAMWTGNLDVHDLCLEVPNEITHNCTLSEGWNLISWNVDTETDDILTVLSSIEPCLELVMGFEQGALVFDKDLPMFSNLWQVDHLSGYWVKVSCDIDLDVVGTPILATTPINVTAGWNLISYLPESAMSIDVALGTIMDDMIIALGYDGFPDLPYSYVPGLGTPPNDLNFMGSCLGYWVKVRNDGQIIYNDELDLVSSKTIAGNNKSSSKEFTATATWLNVYSHNLTLNGEAIASGSQINAFNGDGLKIGSFTMKQNSRFGFMSIYGDDPTTSEIDGIKSGEKFYLTVDGLKTEEQFTWTSSGDKLEISGLSSKGTSEANLPDSYSLLQNYPNPFNPITNIEFSLAKAGHAKIEIFNMLGELVATPYDNYAQAGFNTIEWDGKNSKGKSVASGIYFYRLTADNYNDTKKMTLIK